MRQASARAIRTIAIIVLFVSAGIATGAGAQVRPDSVRRDSVKVALPIPDRLRDSLRADSIRRASTTGARADGEVVKPDSIALAERDRRDSALAARARDTLKAPTARFELPGQFDITDRLTFTREQILSSGAVNIADILDRVPGVTTFRAGWLAGVHTASFQSDFSRIRYFIDGVEIDPLQPRELGVLDLTDIPLWTLDRLVVERAASETRVWMQSWSTERTTAYTRADIFTGDLNTNGFRALFARRYRNGFALQFGGQQAATQTGRVSQFATGGTESSAGDGSQQMVNLRLGWARGRLSIDAYGNASTRDRDPQSPRNEDFTALPAFKGSRREVYMRVGYGDTLRGVWSHAIVNLLRTRLEGIRAGDTSSVISPPDTTPLVDADTVAGRTQQILAVGYRAARWQVSALDRVRPIDGRVFHAPAARASFGTSRYSIGGYVERNAADSTRRADLFGRAQPLPWLTVSAAFSDRAPIGDSTRRAGQSARLEGAIRVRGAWLGGGFIRAAATEFDSPAILGAGVQTRSVPNPATEDTTDRISIVQPFSLIAGASNGILVSARGPIYKDLRLDVGVVRWNTAQYGRPRMHARTELSLISNWLSKFPKGQFGIDARITHDQRDPVPIFFGVDSAGSIDQRTTQSAAVITGQLQIRIQRASIFYIYRNLTGGAYEQIPGLSMPPAVQMYGVRWEFFN